MLILIFINAQYLQNVLTLKKVQMVKTTLRFPPPNTGWWNTGLVSSGVSLTSWGEGASLALVGHPSSDGVMIKMPYGVDVLHRPALHPIFSYWVG